MSYTDLTRGDRSTRQTIIEAAGNVVAPTDVITPLVELLDHHRTNDELDPAGWVNALEAAGGQVTLYFELPADHEWWLSYDDGWAGDRGEYGTYRPFVLWSTYPSGPWEQTRLAGEILRYNIEAIGEGVEGTGIRRSRVVCIQDAPEFVRDAVAAGSD